MNNTIKTLGLVGSLAIAGTGCSRQPVNLTHVKLGGNSYVDRPEVVCAFYDSEGNRTPIVNRDINFDQKAAYDENGPRYQGDYNVNAYQDSFLGIKGRIIGTNFVDNTKQYKQ
jgi:hypothetical protein